MNLDDQIRALLEAQGKAEQDQDSEDSKQKVQSQSVQQPESQLPQSSDQQDQEQQDPAVTLDNPITPGLVSPENEIEVAREQGEKDEEEENKKQNVVANESLIDLLGDDFSDDFKFKASTIFEAAVNARVAEIRKHLMEKHESAITDIEQRTQEFAENKIESVLEELCEDWRSENQLAIDAGIKVQLAETFMSNLRQVFEQHNVEMPVAKVDLYQAALNEKADLESALMEAVDTNKQLLEELNIIRRDNIIAESVQELSAFESAKFRELVEDFDYRNEIEFRRKMSIVKQSFFEGKQSRVKKSREQIAEEFVSAPIIEETPSTNIVMEDRTMSSYLRAINGRQI